MGIRKLLLCACSVMLVLVAAAPALADGSEAETRVREANDRLRELLRSDEASAEIGTLVDSLLDYEGIARGALDAHWDRLTAAQRTEFIDLFKQLVAKAYRDNLKDTLDNIAIDFLGWEMTPRSSVVVKTRVRKIQTRRNRRAEALINYEMHLVEGVWKMIDVTTDEVSLVQSYRDSFNNIIGEAANFDAGWADLLGRMRRKLEE
jgi:phospholipid transport system substrate-binding protein